MSGRSRLQLVSAGSPELLLHIWEEAADRQLQRPPLPPPLPPPSARPTGCQCLSSVLAESTGGRVHVKATQANQTWAVFKALHTFALMIGNLQRRRTNIDLGDLLPQ
jgi:hypothetical protein